MSDRKRRYPVMTEVIKDIENVPDLAKKLLADITEYEATRGEQAKFRCYENLHTLTYAMTQAQECIVRNEHDALLRSIRSKS